MKTSVDQLTPTRVKLTLTVEPSELKPFIDAAYASIGEQVQVPGFRKGKVPSQIIDNRVGREVVLDQAISDSLDRFYQQALAETEQQPLGRPQADVTTTPEVADFSGDLVVDVEVDVRPKIELPEYKGLKVEVDAAEVTDEDIDAEIETLRERFGTLTTVERPIENGDFATIDLIAKVDGEVVDEATGLSHEVGSGELLEGTDDALLTLTAGEETTFNSTLLGGDHEGDQAEITVTVEAVKVRELPEVDDEFAQLASEFDTVEELREDLRDQAAKKKTFEQLDQARKVVIDRILEAVEIPVPEGIIDDEVARHLEQEGLEPGDDHGAEVRVDAERGFRQQIVLDEIIKAEDVQVEQDEFTEYLFQQSSQYGIPPQQFIEIMQQNNQLQQLIGEVARSKATLYLLADAEVVDSNGDAVDISEFVAPVTEARAKRAAAAEETDADAAAKA